MTPPIEVITKIADALEVSIDYLVGKISAELALDKTALQRLEEISKLPEEEKA